MKSLKTSTKKEKTSSRKAAEPTKEASKPVQIEATAVDPVALAKRRWEEMNNIQTSSGIVKTGGLNLPAYIVKKWPKPKGNDFSTSYLAVLGHDFSKAELGPDCTKRVTQDGAVEIDDHMLRVTKAGGGGKKRETTKDDKITYRPLGVIQFLGISDKKVPKNLPVGGLATVYDLKAILRPTKKKNAETADSEVFQDKDKDKSVEVLRPGREQIEFPADLGADFSGDGTFFRSVAVLDAAPSSTQATADAKPELSRFMECDGVVPEIPFRGTVHCSEYIFRDLWNKRNELGPLFLDSLAKPESAGLLFVHPGIPEDVLKDSDGDLFHGYWLVSKQEPGSKLFRDNEKTMIRTPQARIVLGGEVWPQGESYSVAAESDTRRAIGTTVTIFEDPVQCFGFSSVVIWERLAMRLLLNNAVPMVVIATTPKDKQSEVLGIDMTNEFGADTFYCSTTCGSIYLDVHALYRNIGIKVSRAIVEENILPKLKASGLVKDPLTSVPVNKYDVIVCLNECQLQKDHYKNVLEYRAITSRDVRPYVQKYHGVGCEAMTEEQGDTFVVDDLRTLDDVVMVVAMFPSPLYKPKALGPPAKKQKTGGDVA